MLYGGIQSRIPSEIDKTTTANLHATIQMDIVQLFNDSNLISFFRCT